MKNICLVIILLLFGCKKPFSELYETVDAELVSELSDTCLLSSISSTNLSKVEELVNINYAKIEKGFANQFTRSNFLTNKNKSVSRLILNDSLSVIDGDSIFLIKKNRYVERIVTRKKPLDLEFDQFEYKFFYKDSLLDRRFMFVNGDTIPYFESKYTYVGSNLTKVEMYFSPTGKLIFESTLIYERGINVKPWLYLYTDYFSIPDYLLVFNFGTMPSGIITSIVSVLYDPETNDKIGEWETEFSRYKISKDKYVLSVSNAGDRIEGLPYLFQNAKLKYQCKN